MNVIVVIMRLPRKLRYRSGLLKNTIIFFAFVVMYFMTRSDSNKQLHLGHREEEFVLRRSNRLFSGSFQLPGVKPWKLFCWILTKPENLDTRTQLIKRTWGRRCDKIIYMSSVTNDTFPTIGLNTGEGNKRFQAQKAIKAWTYIYDHYGEDFDFYYKADDDTYAVIENLRLFLSDKNPNAPEFYGHRFHLRSKNLTYMSGGPGCVLTRRAVELLVTKAFQERPDCIPDGPGEDWKTSRCLTWAGAKAVDTRDEQGRERFLVFPVKSHILNKFPNWYHNFDTDKALSGHKCCSYYPISFHYVRSNEMLVYEWYFYHSSVYGYHGEEDGRDFVQLDSLRDENFTYLWQHSGQKDMAYSYGRVEAIRPGAGPMLPPHLIDAPFPEPFGGMDGGQPQRLQNAAAFGHRGNRVHELFGKRERGI